MIQDQKQDSQLFILDDVPMGLAVLRQDLVVMHWNRTLEHWTGVQREELVGRQLDRVFPRSIAASLAQTIRTLSGGRPRAHIQQERDDPLAPPGAEKSQQVVLTPVIHGPPGLPCYLLTIPATPERPRATTPGEVTNGEDEISIRARLHEIGIDEDPETMSALLTDFVDSAGNLASRLMAAVHQGDREEVRSIAHRLAGSAITLGAQSLGSMARELENLSQEIGEDEMEQLAGRLLGKIERVRGICRGMT
ncbi:MAG: Hpt domain-containing protein [Planctomycetota bacterium]